MSTVAELHGIPFLDDSATAPSLTERGFKWFFRTTPTDIVHVEGMLSLLKELKETRPDLNLRRLAIVCEDTLFGQDTAKLLKEKAPEYGYEVVVDIAYPHEATDVDAEVLSVKRANPDVIFMSSYDSDAMLFQKTYKRYDINIQIIGNGTGHLDRIFVDTLGSDVNSVLTRDLWSDSMLESIPIAGQLHQLLLDRGMEEGMGEEQGRTYIAFMTLIDAINRAGSTDPEAIRQALVETDIPGNLLALPWEGVKFDENGQNIYGRAIITQWQNQRLVAVWPWEIAEEKVVWHLPPWSER